MKFRATAYNDLGMTFQFTFCNPNWNGIKEVARKTLDQVVSDNKLHQKYGPWDYIILRSVDVTA